MNFTCPYCGAHATITPPNQDTYLRIIDIAEDHLSYKSKVATTYAAIACPNKDCKKLSFSVSLTQGAKDQWGNWHDTSNIQVWKLLPESNAKPQPNYIPTAIVTDYYEACRIKDLSPKSSAALSRRCLQGMIRDFWSIKKGRLVDEVLALSGQVSSDTWDSIDAVRSVGNIGAHMEKDVNLIIDIEPSEAELLLGLIEDLLTDWYVTRHERQERNAKIKKLAAEKNAAKKKSVSAVAPTTPAAPVK